MPVYPGALKWRFCNSCGNVVFYSVYASLLLALVPSLNHFDFRAGSETSVIPEGDFVQLDLLAMS